MAHVDNAGVALHFEEKGRGEPPLVFVHGWCCDHTFFAPQFQHFSDSRRVVAVDLRGCGLSDRGDTYEMALFADDVAHVCRELTLSPAVIVGHSLGGMVGIELAARHPTLVASVVAVDPGPIDPLPASRRAFEAFVTQAHGPDGEAVRRALVESNFLPSDDPVRRRKIVETMCAVPLHEAAAMFEPAMRWNGVGALRLCQVPVLVLLSATGNSNDPARLRAVKPDVHIGVTVGAGHFHQLEVPEQVNAMIERFLAVALAPHP